MKKILFLFFFVCTAMSAQRTDPDSVLYKYGRDYMSNPEKARKYLLDGIKLAEKKNDKYHIAVYMVKLIGQKTYVRDYDGAFKQFELTKKYCIDNKIKLQLPCAYSQIAETCFYKEDMNLAIKYFKSADSLFAKINDHIGVVITKNNIAQMYQSTGKFDFAITYLLDAIKNIDTSQYRYIKVSMFNNLSVLYRQINNPKKAEESIRKALHTAQNDNTHQDGLVTSYILLSNLLLETNRYDECEINQKKALRVIDSLGMDSFRFDLYKSKINLLMMKDKSAEAKKLIVETLALGEKYKKNTDEMYPLKSNLAKIYSSEGENSKAIKLFNELLIEAKEMNRLDDISSIYNDLSDCYSETGDFKKAYETHKMFTIYNDSILGKEKQKFFKDAEVKYETAKKEKLLAENKIQLLQKETESKKKSMTIIFLSILAFFIALFGLLIYRQQKLKANQKDQEFQLKTAISQIETQNKLQEQRLSISRDLHDNIGAQLTFIISSVDNVKYGFDIQNSKLTSKLDNISNFTKSTIIELRDTIWAMNNTEITFEDLRARIFNFLEKAKTAKENIHYKFNIENNLNDLKLTSIQGINIYRTIQEAVNNAIKYADAEEITINAKFTGDQIEIEVKDDGNGFDINEIPSGNGLNNMQKRMDDIDAVLKIQSETGKGTSIIILLNPDAKTA